MVSIRKRAGRTIGLVLAGVCSGALLVALAGCGSDDPKPPPPVPPTITSFAPTSGPVGTTVQIVGTGFNTQGFNIVTFNGTEATVSSATATLLIVTVPKGATTGKITVSNMGLSATSAEDFTVKKGQVTPPTEPPTISSFSPINGPVGTKVTIVGTNFAETALTDNTVTIGGALSTVAAATSTEIQVTVPETAVTGPIKVSTVAGSATTKAHFTVSKVPVAPANPTAIAASDTQITLSWAPSDGATGYNIYRTTTPGVALTAANKLPASPVASSPYPDTGLTTGTAYYYVVTALNANGESKPSKEVSAIPTVPPPAPPTITGFTPTNGMVGTSVTIYGTNFSPLVPNNTVTFNNVPAVVGTATTATLTVTVPAGATTGKIAVTTAAGTALSASPFTVLQPLPPTITSFTPTNAVVGSEVTIFGANFSTVATANTVAFNGVVATVSTASATQLTVTVPVGATTGYLAVTTAAGTAQSKTVFTVLTPPDVPSNPTATAVSPSQVNVSWGPVAKTTGYNLYRSTLPGVTVSAGNRITPTPVAGPPFNNTGLTAGVHYYYVVTSVNANGESAPSKEVGAVPTTPPPGPPTVTGFTPTNGPVGTTVTITGTNFSTAATNNTVAFNGVPTTISAATVTQLTVTVPVGATTGFITVTTAVGAAKSASPFTVLQPSPPTITSFSPTNGIVGSAVTINGNNFAAVPAANTVSFNGVVAAVTAASTTQLTATVPLGATTGKISVTTSAGTATSTAVFSVLLPPTAPANPTAVPVTATQVNLGWSAVAGASGYNIYRGTGPGVTPTAGNKITASPVVAPPYSDSPLVADTTYYYIVTAVNANGESLPSKEVSAMPTTPPPAPPTITNFTPTNGTVGTTVTITGANFAAAAVNNTVTFNGTPATVLLASATSLTVSVPVGATTGPIKVITAAGQATSSTSFTVTAAVPVAPGGVTAVPGVGQITISWQAVVGAVSYNIYYTTGTTPPTIAAGTKLANVVSPYKHNNLTTNLSYNYIVTAVNATGESPPSTPVSATPAIPVIVARLVSGTPQTILQNNVQVSVKDNLGAAVTNATVSVNGTNLAYDSGKQQYKGYLNVAAGGPISFSVTINGSSYSLPTGINQFSLYPAITAPLDGATDPPPVQVNWNAGAPLTAAYNYGIILFDTVSINPYWENFLYWNNFISPTLANPGVGSIVPSMNPNSGNVALFVYINRTETITLGGTLGGLSVGSIDIIGASSPITIITKL